MKRFLGTLEAHRTTIGAIEALADPIEAAAVRLAETLQAGGTVFWLGNGGSAADSQHLAAELVGRFEGVDRPGLRSLALTTDTSVLTSLGNDLGFERVFARQVEALCRPDDAVVCLSTSGASRNIVMAARAAREREAWTLGLTGGDGGDLAREADTAIVVPGTSAARVQEAHLVIGHYWCEAIHAKLETERRS
ncbi:MAG: SIS domain-containing protein [Gemmatimonadota bacterium]|nr:SIS domain-containing protein [Gemmatimonadota bacterium]